MGNLSDEEIEKNIKKMKENQKRCLKEYGFYIHNVFSSEEGNYPEGMANSHTHGLSKNYNHPELEMVLALEPNLIGFIINTIADLIKDNGKKLKDEELLYEVIENFPVKIKHVIKNNQTICRIMLPDPNGKFPGEEGCIEPYSLQDKIFFTETENLN